MEIQLSKDVIGKEITSFTYRITREKIKEFLAAINEKNPLYSDKEYAQKFGYKDTPIPPTAYTVIMLWGNPNFFSDMESIGIPKEKFLHFKEEYIGNRIIYPDTVVYVQTVVSDVKLGKMNMVIADTIFRDESQEEYFLTKTTLVIRP